MIQDISQFIKAIVDNMDNTIVGKYDEVEEKTFSCSTKWARAGKEITDEFDTPFVISEVVTDEYIVSDTADGILSLPKPYFIGGTRTAANREWTISESDLTKKTPIIWLLQDIRYIQYGRESVYDWESEVRIFFLDETDVTNFYTFDHIDNVVYPMSRLATEFIKTINKDRAYKTLETWEIINFTRFGVEEQSGYFQNILDANLSGVELRITLMRYKNNCKC
jgi:hypothetical protein